MKVLITQTKSTIVGNNDSNTPVIGIGRLLPNLSTANIGTIISDPSSSLLRDLPQDEQSQMIDVAVRSISDGCVYFVYYWWIVGVAFDL